jgi:hypothetical protein
MQEDFRRNFRIEIMVATETNIKNTLNEGASILHFSCHGDANQLHIEDDKRIGELVMMSQSTFLGFLQNGTLPKAIIFNSCHSMKIAKEVNEKYKEIITIGYNGKALDKVCEEFTNLFYMGLFKDGKSIRQLFKEIKEYVTFKFK